MACIYNGRQYTLTNHKQLHIIGGCIFLYEWFSVVIYISEGTTKISRNPDYSKKDERIFSKDCQTIYKVKYSIND